MQGDKRKKRQWILVVAAGIAALTVVVSGVVYGCLYINDIRNPKMIQYETQTVIETEVEIAVAESEEFTDADESESVTPETENVETEPWQPDWETLQATNSDVYAWLKIPDLEIDYPILQSQKDDYYLRKDINKEYATAGCLYTNACNAKDFTDLNTVIYGHNMRNKTMFGRLSELNDYTEDMECLVYIYTPEKLLTYKVCMTVEFSDIYIPDEYNVKKEKEQKAYLEDLEESGNKYLGACEVLTGLDNVLTLSTCVREEDTKRYLVIAKLISEEVY